MKGSKGAAELLGAGEPIGSHSVDHFVTSFGTSIPFVPGHLEFLEKTIGLSVEPSKDYLHASVNVAGGPEKLDYAAANEQLREKAPAISLKGYAARLWRTYQFLNLLDNAAIPRRFSRCLDIGCGFGIQPRILKALGVVQEAVGIDLYDRCTGIDERVLKKCHRQLRWLALIESIQRRIVNTRRGARSDFERAVLEKVKGTRHYYRDIFGWLADGDFYKLRYVAEPKLDRFICGNIYELQETFDLITVFGSLCWFDAKSIFPKIASLLREGGIFYMWVPLWWSPQIPHHLASHFPYGAQRLTKEDYFRYVDEHLPRHAQALKAAYEAFDPNHPTLADYIDIGFANGLVMLDYKPNVAPNLASKRRAISARGYAEYCPEVPGEVLRDIHMFRPDVRAQDLLIDTVVILFKKMTTQARLDKEKMERIYEEIDFHYRPKGVVMRKVRGLAMRVLESRGST